MKATFDDLLQKKLANDNRKAEMCDIEVFEGKTLAFKRLPEGRVFELIDEFDKVKTTSGADELIRTLIYECCDELHSAELQRKLDVIDPLDTVNALFSFSERTDIGDKLVKFLQLDSEIAGNKIKN